MHDMCKPPLKWAQSLISKTLSVQRSKTRKHSTAEVKWKCVTTDLIVFAMVYEMILRLNSSAKKTLNLVVASLNLC